MPKQDYKLFSTRLPIDIIQEIKKLSQKEGWSLQETVIKLLQESLEKHKKQPDPLERFIGSVNFDIQ